MGRWIDVPCKVWTGATAAGKGKYGHRKIPGSRKNILVHREAINAPDAMEVDHKCCNTLCYEPVHLDLVTPSENKRRYGLRITHCSKGHPYDNENTYIRNKGNGVKQCRMCHRDEMRVYYAKKRAGV